jgi:hypothetical protein
MMRRAFVVGLTSLVLASIFACNKTDGGMTYDFSAIASAAFGKKSRASVSGAKQRAAPTLCSSVICVTPTELTGKYYATGLLIQSSGSGMVGYFGPDNFSDITGTSTTYNFDMNSPITNSGNFRCCGGSGDLSSSNTYVSDIIYMFAYIDATFDISGTATGGMNRQFTVRFVLADDAITSGKRGDLLLKDPADSVFKWIDTSTSAGGIVGNGTLTATRPTTPVTMNTSVTDWTNPFGANQGNQSIPVIFAPVLPESGSGVFVTSQTELAADGKVYTYGFDPDSFVMFPTLLTADINMLSSYTQLLSKIHLAGLPHSAQSQGVGSPAGTELVVTDSL